jgi:pimeloyl-ACP methyl ester carboxylesterase
VRLFAETYPDDVVGLVLIEASVPSMLKTINTEPEFRRLKNVDRMRRIGLVRLMLPRVLHHVKYLSPTARKKYFAINMLDGMNVMREAREVYKGVELADKVEVPLTVISREVFEEASEEMRWQDYQQELVRLSSTSKHIHTNNINHYPMLAEPELVTDAIREMFDKVTK